LTLHKSTTLPIINTHMAQYTRVHHNATNVQDDE
jgi:hypothetical protein